MVNSFFQQAYRCGLRVVSFCICVFWRFWTASICEACSTQRFGLKHKKKSDQTIILMGHLWMCSVILGSAAAQCRPSGGAAFMRDSSRCWCPCAQVPTPNHTGMLLYRIWLMFIEQCGVLCIVHIHVCCSSTQTRAKENMRGVWQPHNAARQSWAR